MFLRYDAAPRAVPVRVCMLCRWKGPHAAFAPAGKRVRGRQVEPRRRAGAEGYFCSVRSFFLFFVTLLLFTFAPGGGGANCRCCGEWRGKLAGRATMRRVQQRQGLGCGAFCQNGAR